MTQKKIIILLYNKVFVIHIYSLFCQKLFNDYQSVQFSENINSTFYVAMQKRKKLIYLSRNFNPYLFLYQDCFLSKMLTRGTVAQNAKNIFKLLQLQLQEIGKERKSISQQLSYLMEVSLSLPFAVFVVVVLNAVTKCTIFPRNTVDGFALET